MHDQRQQAKALRIHGDNILECERALFLIADAFSAGIRQITSPPYMPRHEIVDKDGLLFTVDLFAGHGRWNVNLQEILQSYGAPLREAVDAVVTKALSDEKQEEIILAFEFCSALPAGNNSWQRNGRALACASVGVPYLFFAEIGGIELGANRRIKAPRFPNPIIPFSYLTADKAFNVACLPVYAPSPSSSEAIRVQFSPVFGHEEGQQFIKDIIQNAVTSGSREKLLAKALAIVEILASSRKNVDSLRGAQWTELLSLETPAHKAEWLEQTRMTWARKGAKKVAVTKTFRRLVHLFQDIGCISVGAKNIPLCLIPRQSRQNLAAGLENIYGKQNIPELHHWISESKLPLIVVWITGFKPRGDDSRPDRGLVPLARMLFGNDAQVLPIVYGPAKPATWKSLRQSLEQLAKKNGLWEAIVNLSDAVLVDSNTLTNGPFSRVFSRVHRPIRKPIRFPAATATNLFSEHDVDSTLHALFARQSSYGVFEGMCNPPGGDWSGLSLLDLKSGIEYRWTSLPRVSGNGGKRPDHVIQFFREGESSTLLAIESKNLAADLEKDVGSRLKAYTRRLVRAAPIAIRMSKGEWRLWQSRTDDSVTDFSVMSGGAFRWTTLHELENAMKRGKLDLAFAIEFESVEHSTLLHLRGREDAKALIPKIRELAGQFGGQIEIQVH